MLVRSNVIPWAPAALVAISLLTTSCASDDDSASAPRATASASAPHGYVDGAQEKAEQQSRLLLNDPATGDTRVLDLITGKTHEVSRTTGTTELTTDGRFGYFHIAGGTRVLDSGAWTPASSRATDPPTSARPSHTGHRLVIAAPVHPGLSEVVRADSATWDLPLGGAGHGELPGPHRAERCVPAAGSGMGAGVSGGRPLRHRHPSAKLTWNRHVRHPGRPPGRDPRVHRAQP